ncbi:MAG TPA: hypothetical protein VJA26_10340, partial [Gammaproteobacteria bacterium]|nr:hypothetical protein [Gammaproteobacteria bacterium]
GPDPVTGDLGTSFFAPGIGIFLVGAENVDTDEYDRHVIIHEWGHYFEHTFSRSDSIGGPHTRGDQLDFRVAFGEGWGNALSAMVTGQSVYRDVSGPQQSQGFGFDVEGPLPGNPNPNQGWYSEESIQEILYDLFDNSTLDAAQDGLSLGFGPIHSVLTNHQRTSVGLTSIFPFISALKANQPAEVPFIDNLVNGQSIGTIAIGDDYGTAETNHGDPPSSDLTSVYSTLTVNSGTAVNVCSLDVYTSSFTDSKNKLGSRRFLKFTANAAGSHTITATATAPINAAADPDMVLHQRGRIAQSSDAPDPVLCTQATPPGCRESFSPALTPGDYVLEVFEWTNTNSHDDPDADFRPIGRTCFDVEVTQP